MTLSLAWLGDVLRDAGLTVVETSGWQERSADSGEPPRPVGVLEHHTATWASEDDPAPSVQLCIEGRPDLDGPLCHGLIGFDGTVHLISAGRANHAGEAKMSGPNPSGDGNVLYVGFEWDYQGVEQAPSAEQYDAAVRATEAVLNHLDRPADAARGHRETSVTGKTDPGNVDLDGFRADVAKIVTDERKPQGSGGNSTKANSAEGSSGPASPGQPDSKQSAGQQQASDWGDRERDVLQRIEAELLGRRDQQGEIQGWKTALGPRTVVGMLVDLVNGLLTQQPQTQQPGGGQQGTQQPGQQGIPAQQGAPGQAGAQQNPAVAADPESIKAAFSALAPEQAAPLLAQLVQIQQSRQPTPQQQAQAQQWSN